MATRKIAISVAADLLAETDRLARSHGQTRSGFISNLLARAAHEARNRSISASWDLVMREPRARREQRETALARAEGEVFGDEPGDW